MAPTSLQSSRDGPVCRRLPECRPGGLEQESEQLPGRDSH